MQLDETQLTDLIEKEVARQVSAKVKQLTTKRVEQLVKEVIAHQVNVFIFEQKETLTDVVKREIAYDKERWQQQVVDAVTQHIIEGFTYGLTDKN